MQCSCYCSAGTASNVTFVVTCRGRVYFRAVSRVYVTSHFLFVACEADLSEDASELCKVDTDFLFVLRHLFLLTGLRRTGAVQFCNTVALTD